MRRAGEMPDRAQSARQIGHGVERADRKAQVISGGWQVDQIFVGLATLGRSGKQEVPDR